MNFVLLILLEILALNFDKIQQILVFLTKSKMISFVINNNE